MFDVEKWQEIVKTLSQHKLRTALTAFGVFWGIFMLSVLLAMSKGLENSVWQNFPAVTNSIFIWSSNPTQIPYEGMPIGRRITLKPEDITAIEEQIDSVGLIRGQNSVGLYGGTPPLIVNQDNQKNSTFYVDGTHANMKKLNSMNLIEGRVLNEIDMRQERKVAIIGKRVKDQLFAAGESAIGKTLLVNNISFLVVGVFESTFKGNSQQEEEKLYIPHSTLRKTFNQMGYIGSFLIVPKEGYSASQTMADVKAYLSRVKKFSPEDTQVLGSFNLEEEFHKVKGLFFGINSFSWLVAIGTIFAGVIGVGNIMLIVVKERTREIGLRKALGATRLSIIAMIMQESLLITAVSGYLGLVVGVFTIEGIAKITDTLGPTSPIVNPQVDLNTAITAIIVLMIAGVIASILPATKAANVNPIVALQDE
ncbi:MAG: ABC transporter permease [Cellvibrio sp.]